MERLNEVRMLGNVGQVKEGSGSVYIAVALNESYKKKDETDWTEKTVWVDVVAFGPIMKKVVESGVQKGDGVLVIGKLDMREYEGKRNLQVIAHKVQVVQKPDKSDRRVDTDVVTPDESGAEKDDDDLPF